MKGSWTSVAAQQWSPSTAHLTFIQAFPLEGETMRAGRASGAPPNTDTEGLRDSPSLPVPEGVPSAPLTVAQCRCRTSLAFQSWKSSCQELSHRHADRTHPVRARRAFCTAGSEGRGGSRRHHRGAGWKRGPRGLGCETGANSAAGNSLVLSYRPGRTKCLLSAGSKPLRTQARAVPTPQVPSQAGAWVTRGTAPGNGGETDGQRKRTFSLHSFVGLTIPPDGGG